MFLENLSTWLAKFEHLLVFLTTTFWAIYVYFTIKTFGEIKKQTDLQTDAFLLVSARRPEAPRLRRGFVESRARSAVRFVGDRTSVDAKRLQDKWKVILEKNIPQAIQPEQGMLLVLSNTGKSHVVKWKLGITLKIEPMDYLDKNGNIRSDDAQWEISSAGSDDIIAPDDSISLVVISVGNFPQIECKWTLTYEDMRGKVYKVFSGDQSFSDTNALANPGQYRIISGR